MQSSVDQLPHCLHMISSLHTFLHMQTFSQSGPKSPRVYSFHQHNISIKSFPDWGAAEEYRLGHSSQFSSGDCRADHSYWDSLFLVFNLSASSFFVHHFGHQVLLSPFAASYHLVCSPPPKTTHFRLQQQQSLDVFSNWWPGPLSVLHSAYIL